MLIIEILPDILGHVLILVRISQINDVFFLSLIKWFFDYCLKLNFGKLIVISVPLILNTYRTSSNNSSNGIPGFAKIRWRIISLHCGFNFDEV